MLDLHNIFNARFRKTCKLTCSLHHWFLRRFPRDSWQWAISCQRPTEPQWTHLCGEHRALHYWKTHFVNWPRSFQTLYPLSQLWSFAMAVPSSTALPSYPLAFPIHMLWSRPRGSFPGDLCLHIRKDPACSLCSQHFRLPRCATQNPYTNQTSRVHRCSFLHIRLPSGRGRNLRTLSARLSSRCGVVPRCQCASVKTHGRVSAVWKDTLGTRSGALL